MSTLSEFISRRRGVERRQALNKLLNYYIPPNLRSGLDFLGGLTPSASYEGAVQGFEQSLTPGASMSQRVGGIGQGLTGTAGIAAPLAVAKQAGMPAAQAVQEAFQGFSTGANYAGGVLADRLTQPGEMPTLYSNPIPGILDFTEKASKGRLRQARTTEQDISDILKKKMPATVIDVAGASDDLAIKYETGEITDALERAGLFVSDDGMGKIHVGTTEENLKSIKQAKTPAEIGKLSGYSDEDIAAFYLKRRGGMPELAFEDYIKDVGDKSDSSPVSKLRGPTGKPLKKEELDPLGYQATKMRGILDETEVDLEDLGENLPRIPRSWEEMENKYVIPLYGDRTSRGFLLKGINDLKFDMPVYTEGGLDFMRGPAFQEQNAVWASNSNIIKRIADEAEKARIESKGEDIFGMTGSMAPNANDFATMTGSAIAEQIKGAKITRKGASDFNELVRGAISSDFPGVRSPKLREWIEKTSSPKRKAFIRLIDTKPFQEQGFPSVGLGRYGVTDITQRKLPPGMFGMGVSKFDELQPILRKDPSGNSPGILVPHSTYNTQITGEYFGSLPPVPQGLVFKDVYDAMEGGVTKAGKPLTSAHKTHAIKTIMPVQKLRPDIIEGILGYVSSLEK